jgi:hypothetical protein
MTTFSRFLHAPRGLRGPSAVRIVGAMLAIVFGCVAFADAQTLTFRQIDYYQDGSLDVPFSEWGEFEVAYTPDVAVTQFLNVIANPGTPNESWIIQNHPLLNISDAGSGSYSTTELFDLGSVFGLSRGVDMTGLSFDANVSLNLNPISAPTFGGVNANIPVQPDTAVNIINSGVPSGAPVLNAPAAPAVNWIGLPALPLVYTRPDMPNVVQQRNFCGPGAAANSLHWLAANNDDIDLGTTTVNDTMVKLAPYMGNANDGNWDDTEVEGKLRYIRENNLPIEVHFAGKEKLGAGNYVSPNGFGTARNDGAVTWEWLKQEMDKGQDIEIMTATHWVVLDGYLEWNGAHLLRYRDDPYQHGAATTNDEKNKIANRNTWTYFDDAGFTNIGNGKEKLLTAVAESPDPNQFYVKTGIPFDGSEDYDNIENIIPPNPDYKIFRFIGDASSPNGEASSLIVKFDYIDPELGPQEFLGGTFEIPAGTEPVRIDTGELIVPFCPTNVSVHLSADGPSIDVEGIFHHVCVAVPEPSSATLALVGLVGMFAARRRSIRLAA